MRRDNAPKERPDHLRLEAPVLGIMREELITRDLPTAHSTYLRLSVSGQSVP